jgi:hypothetical protein
MRNVNWDADLHGLWSTVQRHLGHCMKERADWMSEGRARGVCVRVTGEIACLKMLAALQMVITPPSMPPTSMPLGCVYDGGSRRFTLVSGSGQRAKEKRGVPGFAAPPPADLRGAAPHKVVKALGRRDPRRPGEIVALGSHVNMEQLE